MVKHMKFADIIGNDTYGGTNTYRTFFDSDVNGHVIMRVVEGKRTKSRDYTQPNHYHPKRDLFMVGIKGTRIMNVEGKKVLLKPGEILYIEPGNYHFSPEIGAEEFVALELWYSAPGDESEDEQQARLKLAAERAAKEKERAKASKKKK